MSQNSLNHTDPTDPESDPQHCTRNELTNSSTISLNVSFTQAKVFCSAHLPFIKLDVLPNVHTVQVLYVGVFLSKKIYSRE